MSSMSGGIAQPGKGDHDDQDAVEFFGEVQTFAKNETAYHVCHRVDGHEQDAGSENNGFDFGDAVVEGAEKAWQGGHLR